ncbi:uncharacterized protein LOC129564687 [Sitodiplosis mosellana]|uniref:uncharacterized protein LOC129564687 n=1 Tax=Sitodiplosis mosellana TaxID=263140 RepID=UPI0024442B6B|nr:uncharacterized protein LOC129564687 [Sitodiplosis mosellana]
MRSLAVIVLLSVICAINAAVSISLPTKHADHPGKCWDDHLKMEFDIGLNYPKNECMEVHCGGDFSMEIRSCGAVLPPLGYHNERDYSKKYPDCCIKLVKDEIKNEEAEPAPSTA